MTLQKNIDETIEFLEHAIRMRIGHAQDSAILHDRDEYNNQVDDELRTCRRLREGLNEIKKRCSPDDTLVIVPVSKIHRNFFWQLNGIAPDKLEDIIQRFEPILNEIESRRL